MDLLEKPPGTCGFSRGRVIVSRPPLVPEPSELLLPLTSESASILPTNTCVLLGFSLSPGPLPCTSSFLQGTGLGVGRGLAWWVPGEDLPFSCYTDLIPVERRLRIAQLLSCCPGVCSWA